MTTSHYEKKFATIEGRKMAYVEVGHGSPIVFLHGNPTSSYLWRNIIPHVADMGRVVAPDLIGMGDSDKLPDSGPDRYRFVEHQRYLDGLLTELGIDRNAVLVVHDWGSSLGFDWAKRHADAVRGVAYMEGFARPVSWDEWPEQARGIFQGMRSEKGEDLVLQRNVFVEQILPGSILRELEPEEMEEYRRPFREPGESRRPTLTWPREVPIDGHPPDMVGIVDAHARWLSQSEIPKLFVNAEPGAILTGAQREFCRQWPNQREVTVRGVHFIQEDSPNDIGQALRGWLTAL